MHPIWNEIRYTFRQLVKSPGFTLTAVLTLALGIGANTAIFTLVHAVMLKSLPVVDPKHLYQIGNDAKCCVWGGMQDDWTVLSYPLYEEIKKDTPAFEQLAAFQANQLQISVRRSGTVTAAIPLRSEFVTGNYFSTFGLQAFAGRLIADSDDTPNAVPVAVLSYHTWQQRFSLDPSVVGGAFQFDGKPFTVIGIAPPGFYGDRLRENPPDIYLPVHQEPTLAGENPMLHVGDGYWLYAIGRLRADASPTQVGEQLTSLLQRWLPAHVALNQYEKSRLSRQRILLGPGGSGITPMRATFEKGLFLLVCASALVLLIVCANLANLLLARSTTRQQRAALQLAMGASRRRLIRGMLIESMLLSLLGGVAGLVLAYQGTRAILTIAFGERSYIPIETSPSLPVMAFSFVLSLLTGILFGIIPAWIASKSNPAEALRGANRTTNESSALPQKALIISQAALSLVLLAAAGLVSESLSNMEQSKYGFEPHDRLILSMNPLLAGYKPEQLQTLYLQMEDRLRQIPGVRNVSLSLYSPQDGDSWNDSISISGRALPQDYKQSMATWLRISPNYFETIGTPLLAGRTITTTDTETSERIAVIDEAFAKKYFPGQNPMGQHFGSAIEGHTNDFTIVGIVKTNRYKRPLDEQYPMFFLPVAQSVTFSQPHMERMEIDSHYLRAIEFQISGPTANIVSEIRATLASIDPNLTIIEVKSFQEQISSQFNQERLTARLTASFSLLALLLASIGLYGVTAYNVARRTGEIGIRIALGANRQTVIGMVLRDALTQVGIGLAIGLPFAYMGGKAIASQLYGIRYDNPLVILVPMAVLLLCGSIAGFLPAKRAASIEPVQALRSE